jgi:Family of unknown function (DUF6516)
MAKAEPLYRDRMDLPDGHIVEMTIWRLPTPSDERPHGLKYSLFYGRRGERIIGYDNEAGKGDHRHYRGREEPYVFGSVETLIADFLNDVRQERGEA